MIGADALDLARLPSILRCAGSKAVVSLVGPAAGLARVQTSREQAARAVHGKTLQNAEALPPSVGRSEAQPHPRSFP